MVTTPLNETHHRSVTDLFAAQAARTPDALAVRCGSESVSYAELADRTDRVAAQLRRLGVGPDALVGAYVERSVAWVVGLLGILKAGGAYLPLDPVHPRDRLAAMLADARPQVVLVQEHLAPQLPAGDARVVHLDGPLPPSPEPPSGVASPHSLAYGIFTSGSTGAAKAVLVNHRSLANLLRWYRHEFALTPADRCMQQARIGFDACLFELLPGLLAGASVHILDDQTRSSAALLHRWLREERITVGFLPPVLSEALFQEDLTGLPLRLLFTGSDLVRRYPPAALAASYVNTYGPTEATVIVTAGEVAPSPDEPDQPPAIGHPIANTGLYLLDESMREIPAGAVGELYLGGEQLARGYLNDPARTAERFVPDPFSGRAGARLYRTGDLARRRADGGLAFVGRSDTQVKLRGFRVEPGEVEAVLCRHPDVREAAVVATDTAAGTRTLVAYLLPGTGAEPSLPDLRRFLYRNLPYYMVPSAYLLVDAWPAGANGKLDRSRLPQVGRRLAGPAPDAVPRDADESALAAIWAELLGVSQVGRDDNFFELGGHSLIATGLLTRIRETFGVSLPLRTLFESPTLADCAAAVRRARDGADPTDDRPIRPVGRDRDLPLSSPQRRIWFMRRLFPENLAYNFQTTLRFRGHLDEAALRASMAELTRRHEIFRTTFQERGGVPYQSIHPSCPPNVAFVDLSGLGQDDRSAALDAIVDECVHHVFDLSRLPLLRWTLVRLAADEHLLVHVEHHMLHDGWSFTILVEELLRIYQSHLDGRPPGLPELPVQFADYAVWQHDWLRGDEARRQLGYWRRHLAGAPARLTIPADRPRPAVQSLRGATVRAELTAELTDGLRRLAHTEGATLFVAMLAVFEVLMHRYTGSDDLVIGSGIANRHRPETERLIGMLVNNIALRVDASGDPTFRVLLGRVRETALGAYAHQDTPFEQVVEELQPDRDLSHNPLFQVSFAFHDSPMPLLVLPRVSVSVLEGLSNGSAKFDLNVIAIPRREQSVGRADAPPDAGVLLLFEYCSDLFSEATVEQLARRYRHLVAELVADPDQRLSAVPMMTGSERRDLLADSRGAPVPPPPHPTVPEWFEARVARTPDRVAVVHDGDTLTYRELDRRADRVAGLLVRRGLGPEQLVALPLPATPDLVVAVLGVLKAGAVCLVRHPGGSAGDLGALPAPAFTMAAEDLRAAMAEAPSTVDTRLPPRPGSAAVVVTNADRDRWVVLTHDNLVGTVSAVQAALGLGADTAYLVGAPDTTVLDMMATLCAGGRAVLADGAGRGTRVAELIAAGQVTTVRAAADTWREVAATGHPLAGLTAVSTGALPAALARDLAARGARVHRTYGPAEAGLESLHRLVHPREEGDASGFVPLGRPIAGGAAYVLDEHGALAAPGVPGELYLGGPGTARGYLGEPAATAARFVPDHLSGAPGARLYRTGSRVRRRSDGDLEYLGRVDRAAHVGEEPPDRTVEAGPRDDRPAGRPLSSTEAGLAAIWSELLGVEPIHADDNFFRLGGHSLLAMMAVARAQEEFNVEIAAASAFENPTLAGLAAEIDGATALEPMPTRTGARSDETLESLLAEVDRR